MYIHNKKNIQKFNLCLQFLLVPPSFVNRLDSPIYCRNKMFPLLCFPQEFILIIDMFFFTLQMLLEIKVGNDDNGFFSAWF